MVSWRFTESCGNHFGRRYTSSAPPVVPKSAMETATKAKWYHIVTLKIRVSPISYISDESVIAKRPAYVYRVTPPRPRSDDTQQPPSRSRGSTGLYAASVLRTCRVHPPARSPRRGAGRLHVGGPGAGLVEDHLALEPVGIDEEEADGDAEIGDEAVGAAPLDQPPADLVERLLRLRLQPDVVDRTPAEHRRVPRGLGVVGELEHVELRVGADGDEREPALSAVVSLAVADGLVGEHGGAEDVAVEGVEAVGVLREHGHVVDARQQHGPIVDGSE